MNVKKRTYSNVKIVQWAQKGSNPNTILFYSILTLKFVQFYNIIYSWILYASQNKNQSYCMKQDHWYCKDLRCYMAIKTLYAFFWVISRCLNFMCQRFGTHCLFHLHRRVGTYPPMKMVQSVSKRWHIKFRCWGITQKKAYNIQNMAKVWNQEWRHCLEVCVIQLVSHVWILTGLQCNYCY